MTTSSELKLAFTQASSVIQHAFDNQTHALGTETTPPQLIEAIKQFFLIQEKLLDQHAENNPITQDNITQIGEQTISCLIELGAWAERMNLDQEKSILEEIALAAAHWVIKNQGEIRSLDLIVNLLAAKANHTADPTVLSALFHVMNDVMEHTSPEIKSDPDKSDPGRPWRMLNFNFAIVATRTKNRELMLKAFDTLGRNLPEDCPQFFEEGLQQSQKAGYGTEIKSIMAEYFKKWTTLH